jgi:hypothetical protein
MSALKNLTVKDVNEFVNKIETVADLIRRLQRMPQNMRVVDLQKDRFEDVYIDKKYYNDGHEEDVVVVY